jgi:hypothetical protein
MKSPRSLFSENRFHLNTYIIMKKIIISISFCLLATASLLAQARINFANSNLTPLRIHDYSNDTWVTLGAASMPLFGIGPASVRIQLLVGLTPSSLSPALIGPGADQLFVTNSASSLAMFQGTFNGGTSLPLPGFDGTTVAFLQMTFTSVNGSFYGQSSIIQVVPSLLPNIATSVFGAPNTPNAWDAGDPWDGISQLAIEVTVPEPSALALLGSSFFAILLALRATRRSGRASMVLQE